jgi:hypothetical protein
MEEHDRIEATMREGEGGVWEVAVDGEIVLADERREAAEECMEDIKRAVRHEWKRWFAHWHLVRILRALWPDLDENAGWGWRYRSYGALCVFEGERPVPESRPGPWSDEDVAALEHASERVEARVTDVVAAFEGDGWKVTKPGFNKWKHADTGREYWQAHMNLEPPGEWVDRPEPGDMDGGVRRVGERHGRKFTIEGEA